MVEENTVEPGERQQRRDRAGYTVNELRQLVREGIDSGPSLRATMADVKAAARRRLHGP